MKKEKETKKTGWNKALLLLSSIVLIGFFSPAVSAQIGDYSGEYAYLAEIETTSFIPSSIHSGDIISLAIGIKNKGSTYSMENVKGILDTGEQFEPVERESVIPSISEGRTKTLIFKFNVKPNTIPGHYPSTLTITYNRNGIVVAQDFSITISVSDVQEKIDVTLEPRVINPGNQTIVSFVLENVGGNPVSNISFSWGEENSLILPVGSDNQKYVSAILPGEKKEIQYTLAADPNITTGIYPLNIVLSYTDGNGTKTQTSQIGVIIGGKTDFEVSAEIVSSQLSISIANVGSNNAGAVVAKLLIQGNKANSNNSNANSISILGNLNKGDYTIATFQIGGVTGTTPTGTTNSETNLPVNIPPEEVVQGSGFRRFANGDANVFSGMDFSGNQTYSIEISYTDTTGERQTTIKTVSVNSSASLAGISGLNTTVRSKGNVLLVWGLMIGLLIAGIGYNQLKAKKQWKKTLPYFGGVLVLFAVVLLALNNAEWASIIAGILSILLLIQLYKPEWIEEKVTQLKKITKQK